MRLRCLGKDRGVNSMLAIGRLRDALSECGYCLPCKLGLLPLEPPAPRVTSNLSIRYLVVTSLI